jgi:hypothetical protein
MDVSEATLLLEDAFRDAFRRKPHARTPSYAASLAAIRAATEALTLALKRNGATPEGVVVELKRIARSTGGIDYPRDLVSVAMTEALSVYFRPQP